MAGLSRGRTALPPLHDEGCAFVAGGGKNLGALPPSLSPHAARGELGDGDRLDRQDRVAHALDAGGIAEKFFASAEVTVPHAKAVRVRDAILAVETISVADSPPRCMRTEGRRQRAEFLPPPATKAAAFVVKRGEGGASAA